MLLKIYTQHLLIAGISHIMLKWPLCLIKYHDMKAFGRMEVWLQTFLISILDGDELSVSHPGCFTAWKEPTAATG